MFPSEIKAICKLFNPSGPGTWYILIPTGVIPIDSGVSPILPPPPWQNVFPSPNRNSPNFQAHFASPSEETSISQAINSPPNTKFSPPTPPPDIYKFCENGEVFFWDGFVWFGWFCRDIVRPGLHYWAMSRVICWRFLV